MTREIRLVCVTLIVFVCVSPIVFAQKVIPKPICWVTTPIPCTYATAEEGLGPAYECHDCVRLPTSGRMACNMENTNDERRAVADPLETIDDLSDGIGGLSGAVMTPKQCGVRKICDLYCIVDFETGDPECWLRPTPGVPYTLYSGEIFGPPCAP